MVQGAGGGSSSVVHVPTELILRDVDGVLIGRMKVKPRTSLVTLPASSHTSEGGNDDHPACTDSQLSEGLFMDALNPSTCDWYIAKPMPSKLQFSNVQFCAMTAPTITGWLSLTGQMMESCVKG